MVDDEWCISCWLLRSFLRQDDNTRGSMHPVFRRFMRVLMVDDEWCLSCWFLRSFLRQDDNTTRIYESNYPSLHEGVDG